ncbi:uncharacterized protein [Nicotiana sylvestris]|uniref:uncharacterized protein n=1 Tax=Nicotiana sylvestris TaxID=4096 RepID=UPI00388C6D77
MLKKDAATNWIKDCQKAFYRMMEYLSTPPVLVSPEPHDETGRKEQAIYYLSKKFTPYEARYSLLEREDIVESYDGRRMFFDGAANFKGVGVGAVLVSETGQHYPVSSKLRYPCTNNMEEYEACILGLNMAINMNIQELLELRKRFTKTKFWRVPIIQNEFADALATLSSMMQHPDKDFIDPIPVKIHSQPAYCAHVEEEANGKPWFHNIKEYLTKGEYPEHANHTQRHMLWRLSNSFFHSRGTLYKKTPNLGLLRYDKVPPNELNATSLPWPFVAWRMDVIGPIEPTTLNRHRFILVAIDYITKWVKAASYKAVTKKVMADFVRDRISCRFGVPESIITDNASNLNSDLMKAMCETFKIKHKNSTAYRPQMNGVIEAANKNIKKILRKIVENHK